MKKNNLLLLFASSLSCAIFVIVLMSATRQDSFPQAAISNGIINARFYLPDAEKGYYRSTRFDWSANMPELSYKGHSYCSVWFSNYNPLTHDAILGPVESFDPLGYDAAKAGGHFVQVGVGTLTRSSDASYSPFVYYPIVNAGAWKVKKEASSISFIHTLQDSAFAYDYTKTVKLVKGKPVFEITHQLKNTGRQPIVSNVYNHNLFVLDKQPTGPGAVITFPFALSGIPTGQRGFGSGDLAELTDKSIVFNKAIPQKENVYTILQGYGSSASDYDIKIENHKTGAAMRITCNRPLSKLVFWGNTNIYSPEPYIHIEAQPGETFEWKITYELYTCPITQ